MEAAMGWTELVVDAERRLPAICLKCGAKKHIVRRNEKLTAATASQGFGAVGGVCGVMVARTMREDPVAGALVLAGAIVGSVIVGYVVHAHAPKVSLAIPLCRECNVRWQNGVSVRHVLLGLLAIAGVAFAYGFFGHDAVGYVVGSALFVTMIIGAVAFRLRDRFVFAASIQGSRAVLKGVSDEARAAIERRSTVP